MYLLSPRNIRKIGMVVVACSFLGGISCTSTVSKSAMGRDGIATAKAVDESALVGERGEEFDSETAGFIVEATPGSVRDEADGVTGGESHFWIAPLRESSAVFAMVDELPGDLEIPVYRSISVFRRPEGLPFTAAEFDFVDIENDVGEEEEIAAGVEGTTAEHTVPEAVVTKIAPAGEGDVPKDDRYVVKVGDSLWSISREHGTTVAEIKRLNGLKSNQIHPGDRLKLPERKREKGS